MILQSKQKRTALSMLKEHETPFRATKTQTLFKNAANLSLRGSTYDAKHLDRFLGSDFGEKSIFQNSMNKSAISNKKGKSHITSYMSNSSQIKPSISFMSMKREDQKQANYVDLYDGPSSLQKRDGISNFKE